MGFNHRTEMNKKVYRLGVKGEGLALRHHGCARERGRAPPPPRPPAAAAAAAATLLGDETLIPLLTPDRLIVFVF